MNQNFKIINEYVLIEWPESQELMECDGFRDHSSLADCETFGSSAYFVEKEWLDSLCDTKKNDTKRKFKVRINVSSYQINEIEANDFSEALDIAKNIELSSRQLLDNLYIDESNIEISEIKS